LHCGYVLFGFIFRTNGGRGGCRRRGSEILIDLDSVGFVRRNFATKSIREKFKINMPGSFEQKVFLSRAQRNLMTRGNPIFAYHKIGVAPSQTSDPFLYGTPENLNRHLSMLKEAGFFTVKLDEIVTDESKLRTAITFDDGFQNVFEYGLEILARHQTPAIQFIVTGAIGRQNDWDIAKGDVAEPLMNASQIKEWILAGHEIGSHTITHHNLKKLSAAEAREEIFSSKKFLEDTFGVTVKHFCYPFGGWTPSVRNLVNEAGYATACTVDFGVNETGADPFALRRIIPLSRGELLRKVFHRLMQRTRSRAKNVK
jgi:peptidoglycan/xylan/chitin deacetylase (PgdA/CDA1 family)